MITKDDFIDWKKNPVTQTFFAALITKINLGATELSYSAGMDSQEDRFKCGMLRAFREVLEVDLEELEGESDNA